MQHIFLICLGKLNAKYYAEGVADYAKRLTAFCRFKIVELAEEPLREKNLSPADVERTLDKEADRILSAVPKGAKLICLSIDGAALTSEELAAHLENWASSGISHLAFVIGSSHGLHTRVLREAAFSLSLSKMTLPHQMARLVLTEQLYRAFSINARGKYHK